jgi:hypothetical protein
MLVAIYTVAMIAPLRRRIDYLQEYHLKTECAAENEVFLC